LIGQTDKATFSTKDAKCHAMLLCSILL